MDVDYRTAQDKNSLIREHVLDTFHTIFTFRSALLFMFLSLGVTWRCSCPGR